MNMPEVHLEAEHAALLHTLRLHGRLAERSSAADALCALGLATNQNELLALTARGREVHASWARLDADSAASEIIAALYERFLGANEQLLRICTAWQLMPGNVPNDHTDLAYDWKVLDRLQAVHHRVVPIVREAGSQVDRFEPYESRLDSALQRVNSGDHTWFLAPGCDSYHTVWMQFHEDLMLALGLERTTG